ncbi:MAG: Ig-like domain-containing protein, partial [Gemmatimonadaceae bacterium]
MTPAAGGLIASINVNPPTSTVAVGASIPLVAVATDVNGATIAGVPFVWTVRDTSIATISSSGVVQGRAVGTTQVAANANGKSGVAVVTVQKTPVNSVVVRPSHIDAFPGGLTPLSAIAYDAAFNQLADRPITWTSSNTTVATVDTAGTVTARATGAATITATVEGKSDVATITVTQAPIATIGISPNPLSMSVGQTTQLTATPRDASGAPLTGRAVAWTSSNVAVATVSAAGVVTALSAGSDTITATSEGKSATARVDISIFAVGTVAVQPASTSIVERGSTQLSAVVQDVSGATVTGRVVTWTSSNSAIATVSSTGLVTGVLAGAVTITATSEGKSGSGSVSVTLAPVATVSVTPPAPTVTVGQTVAFTATAKDATGFTLTGRTVTWSSIAPGVATVSTTGIASAVSAGIATITATVDGVFASAKLTVVVAPVASVSVVPPSAPLTVGQTATLGAIVKDASGNVLASRVVTWSSSAASVATVSTNGVVTAVGPGTATITATSESQSATALVTVENAPVASVLLAPSSASILVGGTTALVPTIKDASANVLTGRVITWSSSATGVATVSSTGVVTGVAAGSVTITATSEGQSGTATITVTVVPVASVTLAPPTASIVVGATTTLVPTLKDASNNVLTGRVITWSSSATGVATVSSTGVVTGVAAGSAAVTATSEGQSGTATITVTVVPVASVTLAPPTASIVVGATTTLVPTLKDASNNVLTGRVITWSSSATGVATVSASGVVTGVSAGSATITATSEGQ